MSDIRNYISLKDEMSPTLKSIDRAMQNTMRTMQQMDRANRNVERSVQQSAARTGNLAERAASQEEALYQRHYMQLERMALQHQSRMEQIQARASASRYAGMYGGGGFSPFNIVNLSAALYLLKNIESVLSSMMDKPDQALSTKARFGLFNEGPYSSEQLYAQLFQTALATRTGIEDSGNLATRILISGAMRGPEAAVGSLKATELINKALIAGGGTKEENKLALRQLSQSLASGVMQGDELRSIREQTPYLMSIIAQGLGKVDPALKGTEIGDMKQLGKEGELTSERILKAIFAMEPEIDKAFNKMPRTFGQAMTQLGTIWSYFLYLLSQGDGIMGKIRDKAWELADYLTSANGLRFLEKLAGALTMVGDAAIWMIDTVIDGFQWMNDHIEIVSAALIGLASVWLYMGASAAVAWAAAAWPLLLVAAAIALVVYAAYQAGVGVSTSVGVIVGVLFAAAAVVYNILASVVIVVYAVLAVVANAFLATGNVISMAIDTVLIGIISGFAAMGTIVVSILGAIAKGIDAVFGTNLAKGVQGWQNKLDSSAAKLINPLNEDFSSRLNGKYLDPEALMKDIKLKDPLAAFGSGQSLVGNVGKKFDQGIKFDPQNLLESFKLDQVEFKGGKLDEVGKIKDDVKISDEDLEMLKSVAAREFMLNWSQVVPQATITFGDVRETADVNNILRILEDMVDEALATSLVVE